MPKEYTNDQNHRLSLDEMKQFLWGAATHLRGQIDATGYKEYIFPLLFFKRISDVYDEQFEGCVKEGGVEFASMQAEDFVIRIPEGAHWSDVRSVTENVGQRLVEAFIAIEQANPGIHADGRVIGGLEGIFGPKDIWTNKNKMPDHIITSLIEDFSVHNLSLAACPADEMGQTYEYLVGKFADDAGNTAQEFYTNRTVVTLMAEILQPKPDESIYDPTCGSGGMLVKCLDYLREKGEAWQGVKVFGQEINALTSAIARMNLYLNGVEDFSIVREDTLKRPAFGDGSKLRTFDVVLANPPYSIKNWNREAFANDPWGRNFLGTPPQGRADYAFLQHIIASMNPETGRCAILFPHGVLFRKEEKELREKLIKSDKVEAVIGLGPNLFYNSPMEACIIICNNNKTNKRKNKILMINAVNEVIRKNAESFLTPDHIKKILKAYTSSLDIEGFSRLVDNKEILNNNSELTISLYAYTSSIIENRENNDGALDNWDCIRQQLTLELADLTSRLDLEFTFKNFTVDIPKCPFEKMTLKLDDIAEEVRETWKEDKTGIPIVGLENIIPQSLFLTDWEIDPAENTFTKRFCEGQILLGRRRAYQKKACISTISGICSGDIMTIQAKSASSNSKIILDEAGNEIFFSDLLPFIIQNDCFFDYAIQGSAGSLSPRVKWEHLGEYEFSIPKSIEVQKKLADKLWAAYRLKEAYQKLIVATDEMVKSRFIEMFGNLSTKLSTLISVYRGVSFKPSDIREKGDNSVAIIRSNNILNGELNTSELIWIDRSRVSEVQRLKIGDIIVCASNGSKNLVGKTGLNKTLNSNHSIGSFCLLIRPNDNLILPQFLNTFFQTSLYKNQIEELASGSNILNIKSEHLKNLNVPIPPLELQMQFVCLVEQADKSKFELKKAIEAIDQVIKSLING